MNLTNKKVLVTGGCAGIGKSLIKEQVKHGVKDIVVIVRRKEALESAPATIKMKEKLSCKTKKFCSTRRRH